MRDASNRIPFILGCIGLIGFVGVAFNYEGSQLNRFDRWLIGIIQGRESEFLTGASKFLSFIGSSAVVPILAILVMILLFLLKHRLEILVFFLAVGGSALLNEWLKSIYARVRPDIHPLIVESGFSFPSGHSMNAFTFYGMATILLWRNLPSRSGRILLIVFSSLMILAVGFSRVYLGVHYPSDVIGAYLASGAWLTVMVGALRLLSYRKKVSATN